MNEEESGRRLPGYLTAAITRFPLFLRWISGNDRSALSGSVRQAAIAFGRRQRAHLPMDDDIDAEEYDKLFECLNISDILNVSNFHVPDFTNCSFWATNPNETLVAPPGEIGRLHRRSPDALD